jgi:cytidylate kinase
MSRAKGVIVAIDGPAGAGKSTISRKLAETLGYTLVDTGALYRAVALTASRRSVDFNDGPALGALASSLALSFVDGELEVDGARPLEQLRTSEMGLGASKVSAHPEVRAALLGVQRAMGTDGGVVLEGRDIGTVVYPDAELKIFLVASNEERARRRLAELLQQGENATLESVLADMEVRDARDA